MAGFYVVGVDNKPQPHYVGEEFVRADAMAYPLEDFDLIHASPPCQRYSRMSKRTGLADTHPDLISPLRSRLVATGTSYVIENVVGAPLVNPTQLCGSTFDLRIRRHRLFETSFSIVSLPCNHSWQNSDKRFDLYQHGHWYKSGIVHVFGRGGGKGREFWPEAMGIGWMTDAEIVEAVPPAYTRLVGKYFLEADRTSYGLSSR